MTTKELNQKLKALTPAQKDFFIGMVQKHDPRISGDYVTRAWVMTYSHGNFRPTVSVRDSVVQGLLKANFILPTKGPEERRNYFVIPEAIKAAYCTPAPAPAPEEEPNPFIQGHNEAVADALAKEAQANDGPPPWPDPVNGRNIETDFPMFDTARHRATRPLDRIEIGHARESVLCRGELIEAVTMEEHFGNLRGSLEYLVNVIDTLEERQIEEGAVRDAMADYWVTNFIAALEQTRAAILAGGNQ